MACCNIWRSVWDLHLPWESVPLPACLVPLESPLHKGATADRHTEAHQGTRKTGMQFGTCDPGKVAFGGGVINSSVSSGSHWGPKIGFWLAHQWPLPLSLSLKTQGLPSLSSQGSQDGSPVISRALRPPL